MKPSQFSSLTAKQVEIIEQLTAKHTSQRDICRITKHSRGTIRKYQYAYLNRKIIEGLDKHFAETRVYTISFGFVWLVMMLIIVLSGCGFYFLINL